MYVWRLHQDLQHGREPAYPPEDTQGRIHICVQSTGLWKGFPHFIQPQDSCSRSHQGEALWVWCARLWEGLQHFIQVRISFFFSLIYKRVGCCGKQMNVKCWHFFAILHLVEWKDISFILDKPKGKILKKKKKKPGVSVSGGLGSGEGYGNILAHWRFSRAH